MSISPATLTTKDLAARVGVTRRTVQLWYAGQVRPSRLALARLLAAGIILEIPAPKRRRKVGRHR